MGHHKFDLNGEVRQGFLEEMILGLSSEGRVGKRGGEKIIPGGGREQHVQRPCGRWELGGREGIMRCKLPIYPTTSQDSASAAPDS